MTPTMSQITVAIVLVAVNVAIFVWFQRSRAAASAGRMLRMMTHVGLDSGIATHGDPRTRVTMKEARRRCGRCRFEDVCDRWFAGKADEGDTFCPNAPTFRALAGTGGRSG